MKRITDYNIKYAPNEDIINILKTNHLIIVKGVNAQDKILNLLFNLKTVFTECFLLNYSKRKDYDDAERIRDEGMKK